jgi:hypothetical protein
MVMSDNREDAMKMAIKALLVTAKKQGVRMDTLCDGAVEFIGHYPALDRQGLVAATTIRRIAYDVLLDR